MPINTTLDVAAGPHRRSRRLPAGPAVLAALLWLCPTTLRAVTVLDGVDLSADITISLDGTTLDDGNAGADDLAGTVALLDVGGLPDEADLDGYHRLPVGDQLFSLDVTAQLPGNLNAAPGDVVRFDGTTYTLELEGVTAGLPANAVVDAISVVGAGDLLLSFDITVSVDGITVDDEDLVRFDGSTFSLFLDGSAAGVAGSLDLDAAHYIDPNGHLLLSFDSSGVIGGVEFDDEDVLEYDPAVATWEIAYDGSAQHGAWPPGDLDALYGIAAVAGAVPDGDEVPGTPLKASKQAGADGKAAGNITLTWGASCVANDADYAIYEGLLSDFASHIPAGRPVCTTGGATTLTITPRTGNRYYLVVPQGYAYEGSYGNDSSGDERPPSFLHCQPQLVGTCD